ncbi:hypothetical protein F5B22DRAFT_657437 [Xylaria bambusicola]|uniref:uncharacterized protein n=1 Tax=Xylaria bambusicola TaxID=326684 RepID=UPI0020075268|nr:uncharacterized protein F5B22DRAFT_657437 [Xylaria bambusicola]KAI0513000.1 hypothetical protein F5B22DRAFT_657437 [Xylaria bambusicola]
MILIEMPRMQALSLANREKMHMTWNGSWLSRPNEGMLVTSRVKRWASDDDGIVLPTIIIPVVIVFVFVPLSIVMYRSWKWERANGINSKRTQAIEEGVGGFEKAELSSGSSVVINEMDNSSEAQELPDRKDGLPHEVLGATALPQELPAELLEMPAEVISGFRSHGLHYN